MDDISVDSLVGSLFKLGRPISTTDVGSQIKQLKDPLEIIEYANRVLSMAHLGFEQVQFEDGIDTLLLEAQREQIPEARKDGLTQLADRRTIEKRMRENKGKYSTLMMDLDHFKQYNDNYNHFVGDIVLKTVAQIIMGNVRRTEGFVGRYGGEEIYCELNNIGKYEAALVAERIRKDVEQNATKEVSQELNKRGLYTFAERFKNEKVTLSIGVADEKQGEGPDKVRRLADAALYFAKDHGRNQVAIYNPQMNHQ